MINRDVPDIRLAGYLILPDIRSAGYPDTAGYLILPDIRSAGYPVGRISGSNQYLAQKVHLVPVSYTHLTLPTTPYV